MWPFNKPKPLDEAGLLNGFTDWHSHILPGVDDGIRSLADSLELLKEYDNWGVKEVWLTPHIMEDYPNTTQGLRDTFATLCEAYDGPIRLNLAAENMLDSLFEERLSKGDLLPIGPNKDHLLVETSYFYPPMEMDELLEKISHAGFHPLLAHPERYRYMTEKDYHRLRENGVRFQINFNSLVGGYGETARKKAEWLLRNGFAEVLGSDVHRLSSLQTLIGRRPSKNDILKLALGIASEPGI